MAVIFATASQIVIQSFLNCFHFSMIGRRNIELVVEIIILSAVACADYHNWGDAYAVCTSILAFLIILKARFLRFTMVYFLLIS